MAAVAAFVMLPGALCVLAAIVLILALGPVMCRG